MSKLLGVAHRSAGRHADLTHHSFTVRERVARTSGFEVWGFSFQQHKSRRPQPRRSALPAVVGYTLPPWMSGTFACADNSVETPRWGVLCGTASKNETFQRNVSTTPWSLSADQKPTGGNTPAVVATLAGEPLRKRRVAATRESMQAGLVYPVVWL